MKTAEAWNWIHTSICANDPAVHGQLLPTPKMVHFISRVQDDAMESGIKLGTDLYDAACSLMRNQKDEACWNNLQNAAARWDAARQAARNNSINNNNLGAALEKGDPTREGDSAKLAPLTPSHSGSNPLNRCCSGPRIPLETIKQFPHLKCLLRGKSVRIWSNQWTLWWRANGEGYTADVSEAWITKFERAWDETSHCGPEKKIEYRVV